MKTDIPAAALRLLAALPVRTHSFRPAEEGARYLHANRHGIGRGGHNIKAIFVGARRYRSLTEARRALRCGPARLSAMLDCGEARYAGPHE